MHWNDHRGLGPMSLRIRFLKIALIWSYHWIFLIILIMKKSFHYIYYTRGKVRIVWDEPLDGSAKSRRSRCLKIGLIWPFYSIFHSILFSNKSLQNIQLIATIKDKKLSTKSPFCPIFVSPSSIAAMLHFSEKRIL